MRLSYSLVWLMLILAVTNPSSAAIHIEPYLQNPQSDAMTILWWTDASAPTSTVYYGLNNLDNSLAASNDYVASMAKWKHEATLEGLDTQTQYQYKVISGSDESNVYTFNTAKRIDSDFRFAILGDGRTDNDTVIARHRNIATLAMSKGADIIFEVGDMVYDGSIDHWTRFFRKIITSSDPANPGSDVASRIPFLMAVGNHEIYLATNGYTGGNLSTAMPRYKAVSSNPSNGSANPDWEERYYVLKYGCATFIVLDTNNDSFNDNHDLLADGTTPDWSQGSEQYNWMIAQLQQAQNDSVFTFVMFHPAPYSRGVHGDPADNQRGIEIRDLEPIFRQYGVDAVFTSHDHLVEHCLTGPTGFHNNMDVSDPANLNWFVQGNSGQSSRSQDGGWESWMDILNNNAAPFYTVYYYTWAGNDTLCSFLDVDIAYQGLGLWQATFTTRRSDDTAHDTTILQRLDTTYSPACGDRDHPTPTADMDGDCYVTMTDYTAFAEQWGRTDCDPVDKCNRADLITDGAIDLQDLAQLTANWLDCTNPDAPCNYLAGE